MPVQEITKIGKRGTIVIPAQFRQRLGLKEGSHVLIEECEDGFSIRPVAWMPVEIYTPERKAEFLLNNACSRDGYETAKRLVREMGLDPEKIPHKKPWED